jgi:uncharacterized protein
MINRRILVFLILSMFTVGAIGQTVKKKPASKTSAKKTVSKPVVRKTLLWEISGNGLREPSYLYGTMHVLCAEDARISENLKSSIKKAKKVYFEIDMDDMTEMMGGLKYMRMNDGVKLSDLLTKEEYARVEAAFKKSKTPMPMSMINRFKPALVSSLLGEQSMGCTQQKGMEQVIMKEANDNDKMILGLETIQFQSSLFDSIPYDKQAKELLSYIDSMDNYKGMTMEMVNAYKAQDLDKLEMLVSKSDPAMADYMDLMLYGRNRKWVQQMPYLMNEGTLLFAVGAGHLPGEQGVINLLRKRGYVVSPLVNK